MRTVRPIRPTAPWTCLRLMVIIVVPANLAVVLATKRADLQGQIVWPKRTTGQRKKAKKGYDTIAPFAPRQLATKPIAVPKNFLPFQRSGEKIYGPVTSRLQERCLRSMTMVRAKKTFVTVSPTVPTTRTERGEERRAAERQAIVRQGCQLSACTLCQQPSYSTICGVYNCACVPVTLCPPPCSRRSHVIPISHCL